MSFRIAACQMNSQADRAANLATAGRLIDEAVDQSADFVALPEYFNLYGTMDQVLENAEPLHGPTAEFLRRKAREHKIYLHGGSFAQKEDGNDKCSFTNLVFDPQGEIIAHYRKIHLFDIDIAERASGNESDIANPGKEMVTFETELGQFGLTICYDLRFPELFRSLTLAGARVVFLPAAFTLYTGKDHWETLIRARAIENQIFMVAPAQIGTYAPGKQCFGSTMIVDPWGTVLARAPETESVVVADINFERQDKIRNDLPNLKNRQPEVYAESG